MGHCDRADSYPIPIQRPAGAVACWRCCPLRPWCQAHCVHIQTHREGEATRSHENQVSPFLSRLPTLHYLGLIMHYVIPERAAALLYPQVAVRASLASVEISQRPAVPFDSSSPDRSERTLSAIVEAAGAAARERKRTILQEELLGKKLASAMMAKQLRQNAFQSGRLSSAIIGHHLDVSSLRETRSSTLSASPTTSSLDLSSSVSLGVRQSPPSAALELESRRRHSFLGSCSGSLTTSRPSNIAPQPGALDPGNGNDSPPRLELDAALSIKPTAEGSKRPLGDISELPDTGSSDPDPGGNLFWRRAARARLWLGKGRRTGSQDWRVTWWGATILWLLGDTSEASMLVRAVKRFR